MRGQNGVLGGVTVLRGKVEYSISPGKIAPCEFLAVPYCTWANRKIGAMEVWLPRDATSAAATKGE